MNPHFILSGITVEDFLDRLEKIIQKAVKPQTSPLKNTIKYLTAKEVAGMLRITLPTLHQWRKLGMIQGHKIGNRVLYMENEVEEAVSKVSLKYTRAK
jgi:excisionase family DNA binding protein